jgi:hypothetical protein
MESAAPICACPIHIMPPRLANPKISRIDDAGVEGDRSGVEMPAFRGFAAFDAAHYNSLNSESLRL